MTSIDVDPSSIEHKRLLHYTDFDTLKLIMDNKTLQLNNLEVLNDKHEAKRKGIEPFAKKTFVSCFYNCQHEIVPLWYNYGGDENSNKILLRIKNFSGEFEKCFNTNSFIDGNTKKRKPFDTYIWSIQIRDIEYLPIKHEDLTRSYSAPAILKPKNSSQINSTGTLFDITLLGCQKTIHWEYEKETRIICTMGEHHEVSFETMFLMLKEYFFQGM